jgi:hypothetical protein
MAIGAIIVTTIISITLYLSSYRLSEGVRQIIRPSIHRGRAYEFSGTTPTIRNCEEPISQFDMVFFASPSSRNQGEIWAMNLRARSPAQYAEYAETMKRNWQMMNNTLPPKSLRDAPMKKNMTPRIHAPTDTVAIIADVGLPIKQIIPWLQAAVTGADTKRIQFVSQRFEKIDAVVLPEFRRAYFCGTSLEIDPSGIPLTSLSNWGDMSAILERSNVKIRID